MLEKQFMSPPDICRGTDFWMLNDKLEEKELRRQMQSMRAQGVACVIARTYIGLCSDYPGKDWMDKMHIVVDEARKLGMTLYMQAGYMPEAVLDLPPEYSLGDLRAYPAGQGEGQVLDSYDGVDYCLKPSVTILDMLDPTACAFYVKQSYEDMWKDFTDEYGKTIVSMWVDEPSFRKVQMPWTNILPETYKQLWNEEFPMDKVHLLFVDGEGDRMMRLRYWRTVLHLMKNSYFKSISDWGKKNNILFSGHLMEEDTMERQIRATCFTMPMYKYFDVPGIDNLTIQQEWVHGEIKPEVAYESRWRKYGNYNTPLQCSSAAHQAGQNVILAEMYGVSSENLGLRDQKQLFDHFASLGINHRSVHGLFYSLRGRGKRAYPPHVHDYQPYWPKYHLLTDALARETAFVRAGKTVRDVLLLHPIETAFSLYHGGCDSEAGESDNLNHGIRRADEHFNQVILQLVGDQVNFELGDEDTIAEMGSVSENGEFVIGEMSYRTVILPGMDFVRESTLALLKEFSAKGGTVILLDKCPAQTDAGNACTPESFGKAVCVNGAHELIVELSKQPATFRFDQRNDDTGVQILCRKDGESLLFFITNADCRRAAAGNLCVPGEYACRHYEEFDGSISDYPAKLCGGETVVAVSLPAGGSIMLELKPGAPVAAVAVKPRMYMPIEAEWKIDREDPNSLVLEMFRYARNDEPLSEQTYPILAIQARLLGEAFNGELTLETKFKLDKPMAGLKLAVEYPELQKFDIDGIPVSNVSNGSFVCYAFETLDLPALEAGEHTLTIHRHFEPRRKAKSTVTALFENLGGVDLEQMLLLGDFAVRSCIEPGVSSVVRLNEDFVLTDEQKTGFEELVTCGYPFYAGTMTMETEIDVPENAKAVELSLMGLHAGAAEVLVNGEFAGEFCWHPFKVQLKNVKPGKNTLTIRLYATLRNLLGPWHRPEGELGACWGGYTAPNLPWEGGFSHATRKTYENWEEDRKPDKAGWTESYMVLPFGIVDACLSWEV